MIVERPVENMPNPEGVAWTCVKSCHLSPRRRFGITA